MSPPHPKNAVDTRDSDGSSLLEIMVTCVAGLAAIATGVAIPFVADPDLAMAGSLIMANVFVGLLAWVIPRLSCLLGIFGCLGIGILFGAGTALEMLTEKHYDPVKEAELAAQIETFQNIALVAAGVYLLLLLGSLLARLYSR